MLNQEAWEETNNHIDPQREWKTSESAAGGLVNRHPSVSCETEEQEGREREREGEPTQGSNDNKQITQEPRSL